MRSSGIGMNIMRGMQRAKLRKETKKLKQKFKKLEKEAKKETEKARQKAEEARKETETLRIEAEKKKEQFEIDLKKVQEEKESLLKQKTEREEKFRGTKLEEQLKEAQKLRGETVEGEAVDKYERFAEDVVLNRISQEEIKRRWSKLSKEEKESIQRYVNLMNIAKIIVEANQEATSEQHADRLIRERLAETELNAVYHEILADHAAKEVLESYIEKFSEMGV